MIIILLCITIPFSLGYHESVAFHRFHLKFSSLFFLDAQSIIAWLVEAPQTYSFVFIF